MRPEQILPIRVRGDLRIIAMKEYSIFPKALVLDPHHLMLFSIITRILVEEVCPSAEVVGVFSSHS